MNATRVIFVGGWASGDAVFTDLFMRLLRRHAVNLCREPWWGCLEDLGPGWRTDPAEPLRAPGLLRRRIEEWEDPVFLVGWSMGGLLALRTALAHPDRVTGVALLGSTARMTGEGDYPGADRRAVRSMRRQLMLNRERVLAEFFRASLLPRHDEELVGWLIERVEHVNTDLLACGLDYLLTEDLRPHLGGLHMPVLIAHGDEDEIIPPASASWLAQRLPRARFRLYEGQGHRLPESAWGPLVEDLVTFIREASAR